MEISCSAASATGLISFFEAVGSIQARVRQLAGLREFFPPALPTPPARRSRPEQL
jgi:hypothetical protein